MKLFKIKLPIALFLSLLIVLVIGSFSILALNDFYVYKKAVAPKIELTLDMFHFFLGNNIKKEWIKITASKPLNDDESPLKTFHITVKQDALDSLNENLPTSGKNHFVDAYMKVSDDKKIRKVKLRYRGDNNYHWLYKQKSLRIKLAKNDTYNLEKKFNLMNPPHITYMLDYVYYKKSREMGLISPDYFPVRVYINAQYMGVYVYLSQIDESLLRKHKLMPGSIYFGDHSRTDKSRGVPGLWFNAKYWDKKSARNVEQKANREDINFFINAVNNFTDNEFSDFVETYIDKKQIFTYIALDRLYGSNHHDLGHNHKLYFDPYKGKWQFIAWDIRFWNGADNKDYASYPLLFRLKENVKFDAEIDKILYRLIQKNFFESATNIYASIMSKQKKDILSDKYKDSGTWRKNFFPSTFWYSTPYDYNDLIYQLNDSIRITQIRKKKLLKILQDAKITYFIDNNKMYLKVDGNSPVNMYFNEHSFLLYPTRKWINNGLLKYKLLKLHKNKLENTPGFYVLDVSGLELDLCLTDLKFKNVITGEKIIPTIHTFVKVTKHTNKLDYMVNAKEKIILQGINRISSTIIFNENTSVKIENDTIFIMDENTSIYFYGKVTALGTKEKPIRFIAKDPKKPWGLVAVQGKATTGSKFEYVEFENGSIDTRNLIHYTAPFNIHDMDWFEVRHCKIGRNFIGDDSMHIAYAKGIIDSCEFYDARSDALDIDISDVSVTNNIFYKSGNDGLDVMTTTMNASNNVFIDTGDKGISIGEWSEATITNSLFLRTLIGLEIKDKSRVKADNLIFVDSKEKAINLYNKNKRYDEGGFLDADTIYLLGNTQVKADKLSNEKISNRIEGKIPKLKSLEWYRNLENPYLKELKEAEIEYAK